MFANLMNFFKDEEDTNPAFLRLIQTLLLTMIVGCILLMPLPAGIFGTENVDLLSFLLLVVTVVVGSIGLYYTRQGKPFIAKLTIPVFMAISVTYVASAENGLRDTNMVLIPVILIVSALLLGRRAMVVATPLTIAAVLVISYFSLNRTRPFDPVGLTQVATVAGYVIISVVIMRMLVKRMIDSVQKARQSEQLLVAENRELTELKQDLEKRVAQRTADIEEINQYHSRRARQFEGITQVTRAVTTVQDPDTLIPYITQVISEQFSVYHTGIYLLDKQREYAVLRAANSDGGRKMRLRGYKVRVGEAGILGYVTATGQPRVVLDVDMDTAYVKNPDLPNTRSEIALPMRYAGEVIGVLDVQSIEANAFRQDDVEVLLMMADQISAIIKNALTLDQIRHEMIEYEKSVGESARESWKVMRPKSLGLGLRLVENVAAPLDKPLEGEHIQDAIAQNKTIFSNLDNAESNLAIPLRLRGKVIGVINLRANKGYKLTSDDVEIVEAVTERLSLAMETASLLQATRHRADVERVTTEISSKISSSSRLETILQTAAQELSRALGGSDVLVQIEPVAIELGING